MKRTFLTFIVAALVLITTLFWAFNADISGNIQEIIMIGTVFILVGFAVYIGITRARSHLKNEPAEDELSKKIMIRTSSLSYYISIYFWLFLMYISDRSTLETHTMIGAGILGMAVIFFLSWLWIKFRGIKNE